MFLLSVSFVIPLCSVISFIN